MTGPTLTSEAAQAVEKLLDEYTSLPNPRLPGSFVGVTSLASAEPLILAAKGARDVDVSPSEDPRGPVNSQTQLCIASCTKSIAAVAIFLLIQDGKLPGLDSSVGPWIPEMKANGIIEDTKAGKIVPVQGEVTIRMLLDHTSGSAYPFRSADLQKYASENGHVSAFTLSKAAFIRLPLVFEPGTEWIYGYGLDWALLLVQRVVGQGNSVEGFIKERIFGPLGMTRSSFNARLLVNDSSAESLFKSKNGMNIHWRNPDGSLTECTAKHFARIAGTIFQGEGSDELPDIESGGAGLVSTLEDYTKFLHYLLELSQYPESSSSSGIPSSLFIATSLAKELFENPLPPKMCSGLAQALAFEGVADPEGGYEALSYTAGLGSYALSGSKGGLSQGTVFWSGITCLFYTIDPKKKIATIVATQMLPYADKEWKKLVQQVHKIVYDGLEA